MRTNTRGRTRARTHEGAPAFDNITPEQALRRSVLACLLWEDQFYEDGVSIADRIIANTRAAAPDIAAAVARDARGKYNLRHAPLLLAAVLADTARGRPDGLARTVVRDVIQRPDELGELVSIYWRDGKRALPAGMKRGLADAFAKFDAYQFSKYNRDAPVSLRDVAFLCHPRPVDDAQAEVFANLLNKSYMPERTRTAGFPVRERYGTVETETADGTVKAEAVPHLETADTWETNLSAGEGKRDTWERLLREEKLGYMALLRNLRNMEQAGVDSTLVEAAIRARRGARRVLPFRYIAAARAAPRYEPAINDAIEAMLKDTRGWDGMTAVLVDVSASMNNRLSTKSDMRAMDAAAALGMLVPGRKRVFSFSYNTVECPARPGMGGVDAILNSQSHGGTDLGGAVEYVNKQVAYDRLIVVTDEQSHTPVPGPRGRGYMINVASYQNGVGYGPWIHIDGWSEAVLRYIAEFEANEKAA